MEIIKTPDAMMVWADRMRVRERTICLVPTMGFFHEGHLSLMRKGREIAEEVVVSLFVNPMQFGPTEDLDRYPKAFEQDAQMAGDTGVSVLFAPLADDIYPSGFKSKVEVSGLTDQLCGADRPGHFTGVTTVVAKLFHMVKPHFAVFGKKDFQQLTVIKKMVADLNFDVKIIGQPIFREKDGLAMSSRNSYLDTNERQQALCLNRALLLARQKVADGEKNAAGLQEKIVQFISDSGKAEIDYVSIVDCRTLVPCREITDKSLLALAVKIGQTRLIDNTLLMGDSEI